MYLGLGRTGTERFSARAFHDGLDIIGMNVGFHLQPSDKSSSHYKDKAISDKLQWLQCMAKSDTVPFSQYRRRKQHNG
jgi:hypothetical protein